MDIDFRQLVFDAKAWIIEHLGVVPGMYDTFWTCEFSSGVTAIRAGAGM